MERRKLTEEQKQQWAIDGYILLKGVLSADETGNLRREVDRLHRNFVLNKADADPKSGLDRRNVLPDGDAFIHLMDHPGAFDIILELMGPYIQLSMAEAVVRPPNPGYKGFIHTDGGQALRHIRVTETSWPLQIKIQYFLTDVKKPDCGNFTLFPGSHLRPYPEGDLAITAQSPARCSFARKRETRPSFHMPSGMAFPPTSQNGPGRHSFTVIASNCFRTFDFNGHCTEVLAKCTPRQRRLLGDLGRDWRPARTSTVPKTRLRSSNRGLKSPERHSWCPVPRRLLPASFPNLHPGTRHWHCPHP